MGLDYHKYKAMPEYLLSINAGEPPEEWQVTCMLFAPNAPESCRRYLALCQAIYPQLLLSV
jgi:hypothetical protein